MVCLAGLVWFLTSGEVAAQYVRPTTVLFVDTPTTLVLPMDADTMHVIYRPGSRIAVVDTILVRGPQWTWTPREAGGGKLVNCTRRDTACVGTLSKYTVARSGNPIACRGYLAWRGALGVPLAFLNSQ